MSDTTTTTTAAGSFELTSGACRGKTIRTAFAAKGRGYLVKLRNATRGNQPGQAAQRAALEAFLSAETERGIPSRDEPRPRRNIAELARAGVAREAQKGGAAPIEGAEAEKAPARKASDVRPKAQHPQDTARQRVMRDRGEEVQAVDPDPVPTDGPAILEPWPQFTVLWPNGEPRGTHAKGLRLYDDDPLLTWRLPSGQVHSERFKLRIAPDQSRPASPVRSAWAVRQLREQGYTRLQAEVAPGELLPIRPSRRQGSPHVQARPQAAHEDGDMTTPPLVDLDSIGAAGDDPTTLGSPSPED